MLLALASLSLSLLGAECVVTSTTPGSGSGVPSKLPPQVSVTLNGVPAHSNALLVVPPTGFVVNVAWQQTQAEIDFSSLQVVLSRDATSIVLRPAVTQSGSGALAFVYGSGGQPPLPLGSY